MEDWAGRAEALLVARGADGLEHPGGTLLEHLGRVAGLLGEWGAGEDLRAAGLCHACYGTDGFPRPLLGPDERPLLAETIGTEAERLVYLYAGCDRRAVYPRLASSGPLVMTDRFTGHSAAVAEADARAFVELTAANELDLVLVNPDVAATWGPGFFELLVGARRRLSEVGLRAWRAALATPGAPSPSGRAPRSPVA